MTAFALKESQKDTHQLAWEIRSVNHRFLDINLTLPDSFKHFESEFLNALKKQLKRGKVDARLRHTSDNNQKTEILVNESRARALIVACRQIESITDTTEPLKAVDILQWPGVAQETELNADHILAEARMLLDSAIVDLCQNREREGDALATLIDQRCDQIAELIVKVRQRRPKILASLREKILQRIEDLEITPDTNRLEQELVILTQRLDVDEELDRIMAHLDEINRVLESKEPIGRRLDFLMQELNREANTLGSKSHDTATTQITIDLKVIIEQMREQVQNIE
ncbi:MAG: YicC/YloC family endoribonuclease [Thiotrichaceae bacterium]